MSSKKPATPIGIVHCVDCAQWIAGETDDGLGFCDLTMKRTIKTPETQALIPDRQGLPPDMSPSNGYAACFPMAPRRCKFWKLSEKIV